MRINAGLYKGRVLKVPKGAATRPTFTKLKQSVFNISQTFIEGATFLDLFAGAGGMGLEALSRGASFVTFVENERAALQTIRENIAALQVEKQTLLMATNVFSALATLKRSFDIIFADPPYGTAEKSLSDEVLKAVDGSDLLKKGGNLFLEDAMEAYDETLPLQKLHLKSQRRIGRALLRHYVRA